MSAPTEYKFTPVFDEDAFNAIQDADDLNKVFDAALCPLSRDGSVHGATDANETMVFARQLETVRNKVYEKKYAELKGRQLVPTVSENGDMEYVTIRVWDEVTMAKVIADYATDFATVTAVAFEHTMTFFDIGNSYTYSVKDLRRAAAAGVELTSRYATIARRGIELGIDEAVAVGVPSLKSYGLVNNPNVSLLALTTGNWPNSSAEQILADLNQIVTSMWTGTLEIFKPDTLVVSSACYRLLTTKLFNGANASNISVLDMFLKQNPGISVESWTKLATANAAGTNGRMIAYKKDAEVLEFIMGKEFEVFPAEQRGLEFRHPCMATVAGVAVHHPAAVLYIDNQLI